MYLYLIFSKTETWLSKVLRIFLQTKYVHSAISLEETLKTMYSFGRVDPYNPFSGGFTQESFRTGIYIKNQNCECLVYRIQITEDQYAVLMNEISKFLSSSMSFRYNFIGLFTAAFNIPLKRKNYYFCSQFVSELLIKINVLDSSITPELIKPTDLLRLDAKEKVFEGLTRKYEVIPHQIAQ
jgi:hypothetical protein